MRMPHHTAVAALAAILFSLPVLANGASDDRVTLPDGPGSVGGGGGNASVNDSQGSLSLSYPVDVPAGFPGITPGLSFAYNSQAGGASTLGIGWSIGASSIERMTNRGVPDYDVDDHFAVDGSGELIQVAEGEPATFRSRFEGAFERVQWHDRGAGDAGYWTVEHGDGRVSFYGADKDGVVVTSAQERGPEGVFRWLLVDVVEPFGQHLHHTWRIFGSKPLLSELSWVFGTNGVARYKVALDYEDRPDPISVATGGYNDLLQHRLRAVRVLTNTTVIRRYELSYEDEGNAFGRSRLTRIEQFGKDGGLLNKTPIFVYARSVDGTGACDVGDCGRTRLIDIGDIGVNLAAGNVTLLDINGDSLPDLIESRDGEPLRIHTAFLTSDGEQGFLPPVLSALGNATSGFQISSAFTQPLDVDGDGDVDLVSSASASVLINDNSGDFARVESLSNNTQLPDFGEDFGLGDGDELSHTRFVDIDLDRRIDVLRSSSDTTQIFRNVGTNGSNSFTALADVDVIGAGFFEDNLELGDLNGDGLLDAFILAPGSIRYRQNLGKGRWAAFVTIDDVPVTIDEIPFASLEDVDNDGCDDLVVVIANQVKIARNRAGLRFNDVEIIETVDNVSLPSRDGATVLFADMNGNGSNDVVWFSATGQVTVLDVTPVPAHLLARIESSTGSVDEVTWGTANAHRARDNGVGWDLPLPMAALVVDRIESFARANSVDLEVHEISTRQFTGGYYDGEERAFRGFQKTVTATDGGEAVADVITTTTFDVGEGGRPHFAGRPLTVQTAGDDGTLFTFDTTTWEDCPVDAFPGTTATDAILFACATHSTRVVQEGADESAWITIESESTYDGYGRVASTIEHGITSIGGGGCGDYAPGGATVCDGTLPGHGGACGADCLGDESFSTSVWADPADNVEGRWLLEQLVRTEAHDGQGGRVAITERFYDGDAFVGLPAGQIGKGLLTRRRKSVGDGEFIEDIRRRYDVDGNNIEELSPSADPNGTGDRVTRTWDAIGLNVLAETEVVTRGAGTENGPRHLVKRYTYDPFFGLLESATSISIEGEEATGTSFYGYDEHGRIAMMVAPGDSLTTPTRTYTYELGSPFSRFVTKVRGERGGEQDIERIECVDGHGRTVQIRERYDDTQYQVSGYTVFDSRGNSVRTFDPYLSPTGLCADDIDAGTGNVASSRFDAMGREIETTSTAGHITRRVYQPLRTEMWSEDDLDPTAVGHDTPAVIFYDGRDRPVVITRQESVSAAPEQFQFRYDDIGKLAATIDPEGNLKVQTHDLLGRITSVDDVNEGRSTYAYDVDSNLVREEHADGTVIERIYDDLGRILEESVVGARDTTLVESFYDVHPECPNIGCDGTAGRLAGIRSHTPIGIAVDAFAYDSRGRATKSVRDVAGFAAVTTYAWDNADRLIETGLPDGRVVATTVNHRGDVTAIPGYVDQIEHDDEGRLSSYRRHNGVETAFTYDDEDRVASIQTRSGALDVVNLQFRRDDTGDLTAITDGAQADRFSATKEMTYDGHGRLASIVMGAGASLERVTFAYDSQDRVLSKVSDLGAESDEHQGAMFYSAGPSQALSATERGDYAYDVRGRLVSRSGTDQLDVRWTPRGRLESVDRQYEGGTVRTEWAWAGQRLKLWRQSGSEETIWVTDGYTIVDGVGRVAIKVAGDTVVEEDDVSITPQVIGDEDGDNRITSFDAAQKAVGPEQRRALRAAARTLLAGEDGRDRAWFASDHQGSVLAVLDDDGSITERFAFGISGQLRASSAERTEHLCALGVDRDGSGVVDLGERALLPGEGRFLNADPTYRLLGNATFEGMPSAFGGYSYAGNNPITSVDVDGRSEGAKWAWIAGATVAGVAVGAGLAVLTATGILPSIAVALGVAAGATMLVGAIIGGVTSFFTELALQRFALRANAFSNEAVGNKYQTSNKAFARAAVKVLLATAIGTVSGMFSGGASAILTVVGGLAGIIEYKVKGHHKVFAFIHGLLLGYGGIEGTLEDIGTATDTISTVADGKNDGSAKDRAIDTERKAKGNARANTLLPPKLRNIEQGEAGQGLTSQKASVDTSGAKKGHKTKTKKSSAKKVGGGNYRKMTLQ